MEVISTEKLPIKMWTQESSVEPEALQQLRNTANLPFVVKHVAVMPDVHLGVGATIGSVVATRGAIVPAAVGVDIGCGMMAVKLNHDARLIRDKLPEIRHSIERSIPVGFGQNRRIEERVEQWEGWAKFHTEDKQLKEKALHQLGSLGGGNHFVEICLDTEGKPWVMLHSGSRGTGNLLARRHIESAKGLMKKFFIDLPDPDLAYHVEKTPEFDAYMYDLNWCQDYAFENRREMMRRVLKDLAYAINGGEPLSTDLMVNCHHNYVDKEHHFGENLYVTRKGAVRARQGDYGIIPGSMGAKSFIVAGKGNEQSFHSCSHGAGRKMSRTKAKATFTLEDLAAQTAGVECRKDAGVIDEIPGAYKDIDEVMKNQEDLVSIVAELKQIMCIKG